MSKKKHEIFEYIKQLVRAEIALREQNSLLLERYRPNDDEKEINRDWRREENIPGLAYTHDALDRDKSKVKLVMIFAPLRGWKWSNKFAIKAARCKSQWVLGSYLEKNRIVLREGDLFKGDKDECLQKSQPGTEGAEGQESDDTTTDVGRTNIKATARVRANKARRRCRYIGRRQTRIKYKTKMKSRYDTTNCRAFTKLYNDLAKAGIINQTRKRTAVIQNGTWKHVKSGQKFKKDRIFGPKHWKALLELEEKMRSQTPQPPQPAPVPTPVKTADKKPVKKKHAHPGKWKQTDEEIKMILATPHTTVHYARAFDDLLKQKHPGAIAHLKGDYKLALDLAKYGGKFEKGEPGYGMTRAEGALRLLKFVISRAGEEYANDRKLKKRAERAFQKLSKNIPKTQSKGT